MMVLHLGKMVKFTPQKLTRNVRRVNQIDAIRLDSDLVEILMKQLSKIFEHFDVDLFHKLRPELELLFGAMIFCFTIFANEPTPGSKMQNLRFRTPLSSRQKGAYLLMTVGLRFAFQRLSQLASDLRWGERTNGREKLIWLSLRWCEIGTSILQLGNSLMFMHFGKYRLLSERILGIEMAFINPGVSQLLNFDMMNNLLLFRGFSELLTYLRPLVSKDSLKSVLYKILGRRAQFPLHLPPTVCGICHRPPCQLSLGACGHPFCYYCVASVCMDDSNAECPRCGLVIAHHTRS